ncbi:hypothetical protein NECAME_16806 [Necator americanus]|uniref:Uncharacterized protein n=1 Tax=Necator americanus TaxID=51031 RepID=W2TU74_NECAM|nr:hypothetical protein NECAME_16806 [Necator americanus]ETN85333.1 hypothetical protein NECAME_16806 [Necator americanus]
MIMANEDEKGRVPAASSSSKGTSARDPADDEKGALLHKEREAAEKLNPSGKAGEVLFCISNPFLFKICSDALRTEPC